MSKKQLEELLKIHRAQRDYCKRQLDQHYYEMEARDEKTKWINRYLKQKDFV